MEFTFKTAHIKKMCEHREYAVEKLGLEAALDLARKLADMDACDNAREVQELHASDLIEATSEHRWELQLAGGGHMELTDGHVTPRRTQAGAPDWDMVKRLRIEMIGGRND